MENLSGNGLDLALLHTPTLFLPWFFQLATRDPVKMVQTVLMWMKMITSVTVLMDSGVDDASTLVLTDLFYTL